MTSLNTNVLIIIVTWNKKEYVIELLNSLSSLTFPNQQFDILVIDNASTDGTVEALNTQFKDITLICNDENIGGTGGFNTGLKYAFSQPEARYDFLWLLDNDVVVHKNALTELVRLLEDNPDIAVSGSTMMQLDFPWRINEMGAFIDKNTGALLFNRHFETIPAWQGRALSTLLNQDSDLSQQLVNCQSSMDVDYVAAASLLIRTPVAKKTGLWKDFFIHFDDVEWCLRIAKQNHRVVVSAKSLIWHVSAISKVPSWILYYDNRNILYLLKEHSNKQAIKHAQYWTLKKALYYALAGKEDLTVLHIQAIEDFNAHITGKKAINLPYPSLAIKALITVCADPNIKSILIPWTVNLQATQAQNILVKLSKQRPELKLSYLVPAHEVTHSLYGRLPNINTIVISSRFFPRCIKYFQLHKQFDLVFQSDYRLILPLSWLAEKTLFINDENFCVRPRSCLKNLIAISKKLLVLHFQTSK